MVYSPAKVVACIKCDGKVLREDGSTVTLPFGSEYSVLIKNLNSVRIKCKVSVDGTEATDGVWLVVGPNQSFELERFIRSGNLEKGNRFKFIERTGDIEQHRGIKADDGLIRIEYQVEKREVVDEVIHRRHIFDDYDFPPRPWRPARPWTMGSASLGDFTKSSASATKGKAMRTRGLGGPSASAGPKITVAGGNPDILRSATMDWMETSAEMDSDQIIGDSAVPMSDKGITVPGSESNQQFKWADSFETTGQSEVLILQLRGQIGGKKAVQAVTVKSKPKCTSCGRTNKATSKFCGKCGTALEII